MEIDITEGGEILLRHVYNPVIFETSDGKTFAVCMHEDGLEIHMEDDSIKHDGDEKYMKTIYIAHGVVIDLAEEARGSDCPNDNSGMIAVKMGGEFKAQNRRKQCVIKDIEP